MVGNERPGSIAVYSVAAGGMEPVFETLYTEGIPRDDSRTWRQMYDDGDLFAVDPEYLQWVKLKIARLSYNIRPY